MDERRDGRKIEEKDDETQRNKVYTQTRREGEKVERKRRSRRRRMRMRRKV